MMQPFRPLEHPVTSMLLIVLPLLFTGSLISSTVLKSTALIWNQTFMERFCVWNLVTGSLLETNAVKLALSLCGIARFGPTVETSLTSVWFGAYLFIVCLASGVITSVAVFTLYVITRYEYLLSIEVHGAWGLVSALAVGAAQALPAESLIPVPGALGFKVRHLPMTLVLLSGLLYSAGLRSLTRDFPFVCVSTYCGWVYLRFFHCYSGSSAAGDVRKEFQFIMFCPPFTRRILKPFADFCYGVALLLGLFSGRSAVEAAYAQSAGAGGEAGSSQTGAFADGSSSRVELRDPVAERRRARAMKLLDEKFAKLNAAEVSAKRNAPLQWIAAHDLLKQQSHTLEFALRMYVLELSIVVSTMVVLLAVPVVTVDALLTAVF
jgi:membrane associated rhomboid family serine protease